MILLLDFDGVIIDSERDKLQASILSLEWLKLKYQLSYTIDEHALFNAVHGNGAEATLKEICALYPELLPFKAELVEEATQFYTQLLQQPKFIQDTITSIKLILDFSIRICVITNSHEDLVKELLFQVGLQDKLDVFSAKRLGYAKPDPRFYDALMAIVGGERKDCIVVEDSAVGIEAGKKSGMKVVALHRNVAYETESQDFMPDIGEDADEVVNLLSQSQMIHQAIQQYALSGTSPSGNHIKSIDLLTLDDTEKQTLIEQTFQLYQMCFQA
ncbi:HAD family phosphatase [uncultured Shewanella sp.]|uniref:HAD family hydrolase n=1 Tax=uncultured Shewanella sp. TaxID=173975 RepID=UPI0026157DD2|nr:HAD family phosphatase [uncultured Shewanella sp.]